MFAIAARTGDQSATRIPDLIPERDKSLVCRFCKQFAVMLPLHHREACDFPTLLKRVPVHPEMDERHPKLLQKPQRDVTDISMKSEAAGDGAPTTSVLQLTARDGVSRHYGTAHAVR